MAWNEHFRAYLKFEVSRLKFFSNIPRIYYRIFYYFRVPYYSAFEGRRPNLLRGNMHCFVAYIMCFFENYSV